MPGKKAFNGSFLSRLAAAAIAAVLAAPLAAAGDDDRAIVHSPDSTGLEWGPCPEFMPEGCAVAVLHGNPAEPNADILFKVPPGAEVPAHSHTSPQRMVLVSGEMQIQYDGHERETLTVGDYAYGPADLSHDATCDSEEDCVLFIAFEDPVDTIPAGEQQ